MRYRGRGELPPGTTALRYTLHSTHTYVSAPKRHRTADQAPIPATRACPSSLEHPCVSLCALGHRASTRGTDRDSGPTLASPPNHCLLDAGAECVCTRGGFAPGLGVMDTYGSRALGTRLEEGEEPPRVAGSGTRIESANCMNEAERPAAHPALRISASILRSCRRLWTCKCASDV